MCVLQALLSLCSLPRLGLPTSLPGRGKRKEPGEANSPCVSGEAHSESIGVRNTNFPLFFCARLYHSPAFKRRPIYLFIYFISASFSMPFPLLLQLLWLHLLKWSTLANAITDIHPFHPCKLFIIVSLASA